MHGITPQTIRKAVRDVIEATKAAFEIQPRYASQDKFKAMSPAEKKKVLGELEKEMKQAARELNFERAAQLRDIIFELRKTEEMSHVPR